MSTSPSFLPPALSVPFSLTHSTPPSLHPSSMQRYLSLSLSLTHSLLVGVPFICFFFIIILFYFVCFICFFLLQEGVLLLGYYISFFSFFHYLICSGFKFSYFCFKYVCCGLFLSFLSSMRAGHSSSICSCVLLLLQHDNVTCKIVTWPHGTLFSNQSR